MDQLMRPWSRSHADTFRFEDSNSSTGRVNERDQRNRVVHLGLRFSVNALRAGNPLSVDTLSGSTKMIDALGAFRVSYAATSARRVHAIVPLDEIKHASGYGTPSRATTSRLTYTGPARGTGGPKHLRYDKIVAGRASSVG
ncbi:hypothetical protein EVAR_94613_1 [Eumeta japonica]|uniref:Uncharacterized protein n=1 Tax=Eumeta variegata TaxID=151549 RepID=A0A4C1UTG7_EUMVA|nr:hypothetical protein EVAR_94613_1 [Eumeta japonica]